MNATLKGLKAVSMTIVCIVPILIALGYIVSAISATGYYDSKAWQWIAIAFFIDAFGLSLAFGNAKIGIRASSIIFSILGLIGVLKLFT